MLIVTADDFGKTIISTDRILECYRRKRISCTSAMVFMDDSTRAASLAIETNLEVGLHLNFSQTFTFDGLSPKLCTHHEKVKAYLNKKKLFQAIYNPFLNKSFYYLFQAQKDEFQRIYSRSPSFYNGHHHMHLCANVLISQLIPKGSRLRTTFTFKLGEKKFLNILCRQLLKSYISRNFISTNCFFSIDPVQDHERLIKIIDCAAQKDVEIEVHPENSEQFWFLLSDQYKNLIKAVKIGNFNQL